VVCVCCNRLPCICRHCAVCRDHLPHRTNDIYCSWCAEELQVTPDGENRILTFSVQIPANLPLEDQLRATLSIRSAAEAIASVYQVNKETT
jgi:hypothetical protein